MKTLYLECGMGAAGDMLTAALFELCPDKQAFLDRMNSLGLPGVRVESEPVVKCGITGTHMKVTVDGQEEESLDAHVHHEHSHDEDHEHEDHEHEHGHHHHEDHEHEHGHHHHEDHEHEHGHGHGHHHHEEHEHEHGHGHHHEDHEHGHGHHHEDHEHGHHHHHASMDDITRIIDQLDVPEKVREDAKAVYQIIAEAESQVHGHPVVDIHFHEVGTMDAIADVVGVCLLMHQLAPDQVIASPVHVGSGHVHCAHGILPVPAPATARILLGIPCYGGQVQGELCTPTGAALLKHFADHFGDRPVMSVEAIGYGMGKKDFERANCIRAFLGEAEGKLETITKLECNLDDLSAEDIGFTMEQLFLAGARDVYTQSIGMKKCRPGIMLNVICESDNADHLATIIMKNTTTLGIRRLDMRRYVLERSVKTVHTQYGNIRMKYASGMGVHKSKPEYEDVAELAREHGVSPETIRTAAIICSNDTSL